MDKMTDNSYGSPPPYSMDYQPMPPSAYSAPQSQQVVVVSNGQAQAVPLVQTYTAHIVLACFTFWCCGCLFGLTAFILAGH